MDHITAIPPSPRRVAGAVGSGLLLGAAGVIWAFGLDWEYKVAISAGAGLTGLVVAYRSLKPTKLEVRGLQGPFYLRPEEQAPTAIKAQWAFGGGLILSAIAVLWALDIDRRLQIGLTAVAGAGGLTAVWYGQRRFSIYQGEIHSYQDTSLAILRAHDQRLVDKNNPLMVHKLYLGDGAPEAHITMAGWRAMAATHQHAGDILVCNSLEEFTAGLRAFSEGQPLRRAFMVPTYTDGLLDKTKNDQHKIAVLANKVNGTIFITVLDSISGSEWGGPLAGCMGKVRRAIGDAGLPSNTVYRISTHTVQRRWTGCDLFAMNFIEVWLETRRFDGAVTEDGVGTLANPVRFSRLPISYCDMEQSPTGVRAPGALLQYVVKEGEYRLYNKKVDTDLIAMQRRVLGMLEPAAA